MSEKIISDYIEYVQKTIEKFSKIGSLISDNNISSHLLNMALAQYYDISLVLNSEYQRQKIEHALLETDYQIWYDEKFSYAKEIVRAEYEDSKSIKPSVKEYEVTLRRTFKDEWRKWDLDIKESEARVQFLLRMRESLNKYDGILTTLSHNLRSEIKSLSIEDRSNALSENAIQNRQRREFPERTDY